MMRLTWRDGLATMLVAAAALLFVLWETGAALAGTSTRAIGVMVFVLGFAACSSDQEGMASVYGAAGQRRAPMGYVVVASLLGVAALLAGILTLVGGSEAMLVTLVGAMVALWVLATIWHATSGTLRRSGDAALPRV
jgi:hypothetical protein